MVKLIFKIKDKNNDSRKRNDWTKKIAYIVASVVMIIAFTWIAGMTIDAILPTITKINNDAKKALIASINKNSHNIKEENHNKVDY